jgi:predicted ATPase
MFVTKSNQSRLFNCFNLIRTRSFSITSTLSFLESRISTGLLREDLFQREAALKLDELLSNGITSSRKNEHTLSSPPSKSNSAFSNFFGATFNATFPSSAISSRSFQLGGMKMQNGLYMYGGTGCGKSMLMDAFYEASIERGIKNSRRVHFHSFMLEIHQRLHKLRGPSRNGPHPVETIAKEVAHETSLLCFDEFQVTDVADAMILSRLFEGLFDLNVIVVATSNRQPEDLYKNGLNREIFLPFIDLLKKRCAVHYLSSPTDYRFLATAEKEAKQSTWIVIPESFYGNEKDIVEKKVHTAKLLFENKWKDAVLQSLTKRESSIIISVAQQREIKVKRSCDINDLKVSSLSSSLPFARFTFTELCDQPLFAADYSALASSFQTIFIENVPILTLGERNELRRLITLIDILYEHNVQLVVSAASTPQTLFIPVMSRSALVNNPDIEQESIKIKDMSERKSASSKYDEVFAYDRCLSRLVEMGSDDYKNRVWQPNRFS